MIQVLNPDKNVQVLITVYTNQDKLRKNIWKYSNQAIEMKKQSEI